MKTTAQRKRERKRERAERLWGPPGFADFVRALPCLKCAHTSQARCYGPSEVHHDPTAARGGTWRDTTPLGRGCHTGAPDSRHRHKGGYRGFWADLGTTREEANAEIQLLWEAED